MQAIEHFDDLETYTPPGHAGTTNRRLTTGEFCEHFELVHGTLEPGGVAHRHSHDTEAQVIYVLEGEADVVLGEAPVVRCVAGSIIRIEPKLEHEVTSVGATPLKLIIVYSPPLQPR